MAKQNFKRINTPVGVLIYPHLTEADTKFDADGSFHTKFALEGDEAADLIEALEAERDAFYESWLEASKDAKTKAARKKQWAVADVAEVELDDAGEETGRSIFRFKLKHNVTPKNGKPFTQTPTLFDSANQVVEPDGLKLWGGSRTRMNAEVVPYAMDSSKSVGVSLRLRAVQIVELASGQGGGSPFDEYEGGETVQREAAVDKPFDDDDGGEDEADGGDY